MEIRGERTESYDQPIEIPGKAYNTIAQDETLAGEQILTDPTASVNDLKTILYLVHAQHVALTDAVHGL